MGKTKRQQGGTMYDGMMTKEDLDRDIQKGCRVCGETHHSIQYLSAHCHPKYAVVVGYDSLKGAIVITCGLCGRLVLRAKVAES